jgi:hypothetical protein
MNTADTNAGARALGDAIGGLLAAPASIAAALAGAFAGRGAQGCVIPPPCWEPRPFGTCTLTLTPGSTGTIRIRVHNCDWTRRVVGITAAGRLAALLRFEPTTLIVDPQDEAVFRVLVRVPDGVKPGQTIGGPILVRGCVDHFARVVVTVGECAAQSCCDLEVKDCPDHIHHWYDHFYCPRPCRNLSNRGIKDG